MPLACTKTDLPGVLLIKPQVFGDERGYFMESFQAKKYAELGIEEDFVQDNCSHSRRGILRGLHYQLSHPQGKLVMVTRGEVFDVAVDIRLGSPTFGQWAGAILNAENHHQFYVPPGLAHGFVVLSEVADFAYKCTDYYDPSDEGSILWNDPEINIDWPLSGAGIDQPVLSQKDSQAFSLAQAKEQGRLPHYGRVEAVAIS